MVDKAAGFVSLEAQVARLEVLARVRLAHELEELVAPLLAARDARERRGRRCRGALRRGRRRRGAGSSPSGRRAPAADGPAAAPSRNRFWCAWRPGARQPRGDLPPQPSRSRRGGSRCPPPASRRAVCRVAARSSSAAPSRALRAAARRDGRLPARRAPARSRGVGRKAAAFATRCKPPFRWSAWSCPERRQLRALSARARSSMPCTRRSATRRGGDGLLDLGRRLGGGGGGRQQRRRRRSSTGCCGRDARLRRLRRRRRPAAVELIGELKPLRPPPRRPRRGGPKPKWVRPSTGGSARSGNGGGGGRRRRRVRRCGAAAATGHRAGGCCCCGAMCTRATCARPTAHRLSGVLPHRCRAGGWTVAAAPGLLPIRPRLSVGQVSGWHGGSAAMPAARSPTKQARPRRRTGEQRRSSAGGGSGVESTAAPARAAAKRRQPPGLAAPLYLHDGVAPSLGAVRHRHLHPILVFARGSATPPRALDVSGECRRLRFGPARWRRLRAGARRRPLADDGLRVGNYGQCSEGFLPR